MASGYGAGSAVIDHPSKMSANHCGDGSYDMVPLSSSPPSQTTVQCPEIIVLPNELWSRACSYLDQNDLSMIGGVSRIFLSLSSADSMWEAICHRRWRGKQNVTRFEKTSGRGGEEEEEENDGRVEYCSTLLRQFRDDPTLVPPLNIIGHLMHKPKSWKEAYIMAEIDSRRVVISQEELLLFKWQFVYDGSMMGLRNFDRSVMHDLGICEYTSRSEAKWGGVLKGQQLIFAGVTLFVERDPSCWGWIIGKGKRSEYHSLEQES